MKQVFYGRAYEDKMETIFYQLDINEQNCVTLDEFFEATNIIRNTKQLCRPWDKELKIWKKIKGWLRKKLKLDLIAKSPRLEYLMLMIVLVNTIMILI